MSPAPNDKPVKLVRKKLDDAGVAAHFESLAAGAEAIEVRTKDAMSSFSEANAEELAHAAHRLRAGEVAAVQIRFYLDGSWWCDTVMRAGDRFRLVRMEQDDPTDR